MIGRALIQNPKIFSIIHEYATKGKEQTYKSSIEAVREYVGFLESYVDTMPAYWNNPRFRTGLYKTTVIGYIKGIPNYRKMRIKISRMKTHVEILDYVNGEEIEKCMNLPSQKLKQLKPDDDFDLPDHTNPDSIDLVCILYFFRLLQVFVEGIHVAEHTFGFFIYDCQFGFFYFSNSCAVFYSLDDLILACFRNWNYN